MNTRRKASKKPRKKKRPPVKRGRVFYRKNGDRVRRIGHTVVHVKKNGERDLRYKENARYRKAKQTRKRKKEPTIPYEFWSTQLVANLAKLATNKNTKTFYVSSYGQTNKTTLDKIHDMNFALELEYFTEARAQRIVSPQIIYFVETKGKRITLLLDATITQGVDIDMTDYFFTYFNEDSN